MRELRLQWQQVYILWMCGVNNETSINILAWVESQIDLKSRILNEWSLQWSQNPDSVRNGANKIQNSIILTELEAYRHEYLPLCVSCVFNDNKFTILNEWIKQWYQYQHSWQSEVTLILKSWILNGWSQQWSQHPDSLRNWAILLKIL